MGEAVAIAPPPRPVGIHLDIPASEYHHKILGEANNGGLKILRNKTPAHYKAWIEKVEDNSAEAQAKQKRSLKLGRIVHAAILEPERFKREYLLQPDFGPMQSSINRAKRDAWLKDQDPEAIIVEQKDLDTAMAMRESILAHKTARLVIENGKPEVTLYWIDPVTGLQCRARADWWSEELAFAMDLKSCEDASPFAFSRTIVNWEYHVQHCFYADGFRALGAPLDNFLMLPCEKEPPYACAVRHIDAAAEERGFQLLSKSMETLARCVESGRWPAYSENIEQTSLPGYAFYDKD